MDTLRPGSLFPKSKAHVVKRRTQVGRPFGRGARIRTNAQLKYMRRCGKKHVSGRLVISAAEAPDGQGRAVFIISRRYSTKAVVRNRARRLLREVYRRLYSQLGAVWVVFIPRHRMQGTTMQEALEESLRAFQQLGVLPQGPDPETEA